MDSNFTEKNWQFEAAQLILGKILFKIIFFTDTLKSANVKEMFWLVGTYLHHWKALILSAAIIQIQSSQVTNRVSRAELEIITSNMRRTAPNNTQFE